MYLKGWEKVRVNLIRAKDVGIDIITAFHNTYERVEEFETKHSVEGPTDIAALLSRD